MVGLFSGDWVSLRIGDTADAVVLVRCHHGVDGPLWEVEGWMDCAQVLTLGTWLLTRWREHETEEPLSAIEHAESCAGRVEVCDG